MRSLFQLFMYGGALASLVAFALPSLGGRIGGFEVSAEVARYLTWGGLGAVVLGWVGSKATAESEP